MLGSVMAVIVAACVLPIATDDVAPRLSGVLSDAGRPIAGADIQLFSPHAGETARATTDQAGRFSVGPLQKTGPLMPSMGDRVHQYGLRFEVGGRRHTAQFFGIGGLGRSLVCDIASTADMRDGRLPLLREEPLRARGLRCWRATPPQ